MCLSYVKRKSHFLKLENLFKNSEARWYFFDRLLRSFKVKVIWRCIRNELESHLWFSWVIWFELISSEHIGVLEHSTKDRVLGGQPVSSDLWPLLVPPALEAQLRNVCDSGEWRAGQNLSDDCKRTPSPYLVKSI